MSSNIRIAASAIPANTNQRQKIRSRSPSHRTGLFNKIGQNRISPNEDMALPAICNWLGAAGKSDPLNPVNKPLR